MDKRKEGGAYGYRRPLIPRALVGLLLSCLCLTHGFTVDLAD